MAIDVGDPCIDRNSNFGNATGISQQNPANATGTIDYICAYLVTAPGDPVQVASFADEGSNVLSTNGTATTPNGSIGSNEWNAPGDFTAFAINSGEYIGCFYPGAVERSTDDGGSYWYLGGDNIPASSVSFNAYSPRKFSLYCTGTEAGPTVPDQTFAPTAQLSGSGGMIGHVYV